MAQPILLSFGYARAAAKVGYGASSNQAQVIVIFESPASGVYVEWSQSSSMSGSSATATQSGSAGQQKAFTLTGLTANAPFYWRVRTASEISTIGKTQNGRAAGVAHDIGVFADAHEAPMQWGDSTEPAPQTARQAVHLQTMRNAFELGPPLDFGIVLGDSGCYSVWESLAMFPLSNPTYRHPFDAGGGEDVADIATIADHAAGLWPNGQAPLYFGTGDHNGFRAYMRKSMDTTLRDLASAKNFVNSYGAGASIHGDSTNKTNNVGKLILDAIRARFGLPDGTGRFYGAADGCAFAFDWGDALHVWVDVGMATEYNADAATKWDSKGLAFRPGSPQMLTIGPGLWTFLFGADGVIKNSSQAWKFVWMHHLPTCAVGDGKGWGGMGYFFRDADYSGNSVNSYEAGGQNGSPGAEGWQTEYTLDAQYLSRGFIGECTACGVTMIGCGHDHLFCRQSGRGLVLQHFPQTAGSGSAGVYGFGFAGSGGGKYSASVQPASLADFYDLQKSTTYRPNSGHCRLRIGPDAVHVIYHRSYVPGLGVADPIDGIVQNNAIAAEYVIQRAGVGRSRIIDTGNRTIEQTSLTLSETGQRWRTNATDTAKQLKVILDGADRVISTTGGTANNTQIAVQRLTGRDQIITLSVRKKAGTNDVTYIGFRCNCASDPPALNSTSASEGGWFLNLRNAAAPRLYFAPVDSALLLIATVGGAGNGVHALDGTWRDVGIEALANRIKIWWNDATLPIIDYVMPIAAGTLTDGSAVATCAFPLTGSGTFNAGSQSVGLADELALASRDWITLQAFQGATTANMTQFKDLVFRSAPLSRRARSRRRRALQESAR